MIKTNKMKIEIFSCYGLFILITFILLGIHIFGVAGLTIQETTVNIEYGKIVTWKAFTNGIKEISIIDFTSRLSLIFIIRLIVVSTVFYILFIKNFSKQLNTLILAIFVLLLVLIQVPFMTIPLEGLFCMVRSGNLSNGINGELFGEDWFSWLSSDVLLIATAIFGFIFILLKYIKMSLEKENSNALIVKDIV